MGLHLDMAPVAECSNPDSYGTICVKCGDCGRFTKTHIKCDSVMCVNRKGQCCGASEISIEDGICHTFEREGWRDKVGQEGDGDNEKSDPVDSDRGDNRDGN